MMDTALTDAPRVSSMRPRLTWPDAIVIIGAILAFAAGWGLKTWHDDRMHTVVFDEVAIAFPTDWLLAPALPPVRLRAVSDQDGSVSMIYAAQPSDMDDVLMAAATSSLNPARGLTGYTQIRNRQTDIDGIPAVVTEYAYVDTTTPGTVPLVLHGEEYLWLSEGSIHSVSVEAPETKWSQQSRTVDRVVDSLEMRSEAS